MSVNQIEIQSITMLQTYYERSIPMHVDVFSEVVSLSSDGTILASAHFRDCDNRGTVQVFKVHNNFYTPISPKFRGEYPDLYFGNDISLSADGCTLAVAGDGSLRSPGMVQVYRYICRQRWKQLGKSFVGGVGTFLGSSVSLSAGGDILAIGERLYSKKGRVLIYIFRAGCWSQLGDDILAPEGARDFGVSVDLSEGGHSVVIGANGFSGDGRGFVGVYKLRNDHWELVGDGVWGSNGECFGSAVTQANKGEMIAVGSPKAEGGGKVDVYIVRDGKFYEKRQTLLDFGHGASFGCAVALSQRGCSLAVSNIAKDEARGVVHVYKYINGSWVLGPSSIAGIEEEEYFGLSIDISAEGCTIACANYLKKNKHIVFKNKSNFPDSGLTVQSEFSIE